MKIALAGAGAFGEKHLDALRLIDGVEVVSVVGRRLEATQAVAAKYGIRHATTELSEALGQDIVDRHPRLAVFGLHGCAEDVLDGVVQLLIGSREGQLPPEEVIADSRDLLRLGARDE